MLVKEDVKKRRKEIYAKWNNIFALQEKKKSEIVEDLLNSEDSRVNLLIEEINYKEMKKHPATKIAWLLIEDVNKLIKVQDGIDKRQVEIIKEMGKLLDDVLKDWVLKEKEVIRLTAIKEEQKKEEKLEEEVLDEPK